MAHDELRVSLNPCGVRVALTGRWSDLKETIAKDALRLALGHGVMPAKVLPDFRLPALPMRFARALDSLTALQCAVSVQPMPQAGEQ